MVYAVVKFALWVTYSILFQITVSGIENIPEKGSVILCSNHISNFDPGSIGAFSRRKIRFMAKKELYANWFTNWFFRACYAIPIDRSGTDMTAFKTAIKALKSGEAVGIFAQGTRVKEGEAKAAKAGVALFAIKSNSPVVPVAISSSYRFRSKLSIVFGKPMTFEEYKTKKVSSDDLNEIAEKIMERIQTLMQHKA